jgi:hypothetical protein
MREELGYIHSSVGWLLGLVAPRQIHDALIVVKDPAFSLYGILTPQMG